MVPKFSQNFLFNLATTLFCAFKETGLIRKQVGAPTMPSAVIRGSNEFEEDFLVSQNGQSVT
jgi:hypothetical protein